MSMENRGESIAYLAVGWRMLESGTHNPCPKHAITIKKKSIFFPLGPKTAHIQNIQLHSKC